MRLQQPLTSELEPNPLLDKTTVNMLYNEPVRMTVRFFSGVPHPHLLGVRYPDPSFSPLAWPPLLPSLFKHSFRVWKSSTELYGFERK